MADENADRSPRRSPGTRREDGSLPYDPAQVRSQSFDANATGGRHAEHRDQGSYYNPVTGAYGEHFDYPTATGVHHHRERTGATGIYRERDVDIRNDGSKHVHRVYDNPNTGTRIERDYEVVENYET